MKTCCINDCRNPCTKSRRYCREHYLQRQRELAKQRYKIQGKYHYSRTCEICGKEFKGDRKNSRFCSRDCYNTYSRLNSSNANNNYSRAGGGGYSFLHRKLVEEALKRKLGTDEVIHHIDGNPTNNSLSNLIVISRKDHARLHSELNKQYALMTREVGELSKEAWIELKRQITMDWIEANKVIVINVDVTI